MGNYLSLYIKTGFESRNVEVEPSRSVEFLLLLLTLCYSIFIGYCSII